MNLLAKSARMHFCILALALTAIVSAVRAEIKPGTYDLAAIRDATTLETRVVQDWKPAPKDPSIRQKVIEITDLALSVSSPSVRVKIK